MKNSPASQAKKHNLLRSQHASIQSKQPSQRCAPDVYRPQPVPKCLQPKMSDRKQSLACQAKRPPTAPPAYRPQPTPKVLQAKKPVRPLVQERKAPVASHVHNAGRLPVSHQSRPPSSIQKTPSRQAHKPFSPMPARASSTVQRNITWAGGTDFNYGKVIDLVFANAKSKELKTLLEMCRGSDTHLHLKTYDAAKSENGLTTIRVRGEDGHEYDLDDPDQVTWARINQRSPITITISLNSSFVFGHSESVETLLHELDVHATKYAPFIERMRTTHDKRLLKGIWTGAAASSNGAAWQHDQLGRGRNRSLTADLSAVARSMGDPRLAAAAIAEYRSDVQNHQ